MEWDCVIYYGGLETEEKNGKRMLQNQRKLAAVLLKQGFLSCFKEVINESDIGRREDGKPYYKKNEEFYFNISHCSSGVAVAFSHVPIGVDTESCRDIRQSMAHRVLSPLEQVYVFGDGERPAADRPLEPDQAWRFLRLWTLKESYVKMTGEGLRRPLAEVEFILQGALGRKLTETVTEFVLPQKDNVSLLYELPGIIVSASLKTQKEKISTNIRRWRDGEDD